MSGKRRANWETKLDEHRKEVSALVTGLARQNNELEARLERAQRRLRWHTWGLILGGLAVISLVVRHG